MSQRPDGLPLPYPWMVLMFLPSVVVPMTIVGVLLGMGSNPWYWLLVVAIAVGQQVSLYIVKRGNERRFAKRD